MDIFKSVIGKKELESLIAKTDNVEESILKHEERKKYVSYFNFEIENLCNIYDELPPSSPHKLISTMLRTVALGMVEDELTIEKLNAIKFVLKMLLKKKINKEEVEKCYQTLLSKALLSYSYSSGRRTIDGKY
ncbi:MAG: hypothetical protein AB1779_04785 [Candidatus Thermoplasmatota archaeon]